MVCSRNCGRWRAKLNKDEKFKIIVKNGNQTFVYMAYDDFGT